VNEVFHSGVVLPQHWSRLRYHPKQSRLWRSPARRKCVVAGRGSGKTEISRRYIVRALAVVKPWSDPIYVYAMPTYLQIKKVAWEQTIRLIPREWIKDVNKSEMYVDTVFGSRLYFVGVDKPERVEGLQIDGVIGDESSDWKPGAWTKSFMPMLTHRGGFGWRIGVPKRYGIGAKEFREYFARGVQNVGGIESFNWPSTDILTAAELYDLRENMDAMDYGEAVGAEWYDAGGMIFYAFTEAANVKPCKYEPTLPIIVGSDFNITPMAWTFSQLHPDGICRTFSQLFQPNCNTQQALDITWNRFSSHKAGWIFCGDASGQARHTSASVSDYLQIKNDKRFTPKQIHYPSHNPLRKDRFAACNAALRNANGVTRSIVDPSCVPLITDLKARAFKEGTFEPDDSTPGIGHSSDAWGYTMMKIFPLRIDRDESDGTNEVIFVSA